VRRPLPLAAKVTIAFIFFAAVLLLAMGFLVFIVGRDALEESVTGHLSSTALEKEAAFDSWVDDSLYEVTIVAKSSIIRADTALLVSSQDQDELQTAHDHLVAELAHSLDAGTPFLGLFVLHAETGRIVASTNSDEEGRFKEDRQYFIQGRETPYIQNVYYSLQLQEPAMTVSAPIYGEDGVVAGVLVGRLNLAILSEIVTNQSDFYETYDAYFVNRSNLFATQPRFIPDEAVLQRGIRTQSVENCLEGSNGTLIDQDYRNVPVLAAYRWMGERELCLVVNVEEEEAFATINDGFGGSLVIIGGALLLVSLGLALGFARMITRPILRLKEGVIRFGEGALDTRFPETSSAELKALAHEFNAMADLIVEKETRLQNYAKNLEEVVSERTAQLAFLANASQILSESFDYSDKLEKVARLAVPIIGDWCSIDLLDDNGILQKQVIVHSDPQKVALAYELQRRYPPDPNTGAYRALKTGETEFYPEITDEALVAAVPDAERLALIRQLGLTASVTVPLIAQERTLGVITLGMAESGRRFNASDIELIEDLARRAALQLDNAKLYHETQALNAELEQRVTERTAHLMAVNKELEAFSYSVSHDLRAPLRAVDGFSQALLEDYDAVLDDIGRNFLARIRTESQRMGQLIDDLIGLSRYTRTEMNLQEVDLSQMAREIAADLAANEPERTVEFSIQDEITACADGRLMRVALQNLIGNAWKFSSKNPEARIEFGCMDAAEASEYYVRDNGAGFDSAYTNKLFGAFQRLHAMDEFTGTGIGLATVQRIMHRHGGTIRAEGAVNKGAAFYFTLGARYCE
jgi:signal transduction histidine kinase